MDRRLRRSRRGEEPAPVVAPAAAPTQTRRAGSISAAPSIVTATRTREPEPPQLELGPRTRRSSRPRSAAGQPLAAPLKAAIKQPTPIKEVNEVSVWAAPEILTHSLYLYLSLCVYVCVCLSTGLAYGLHCIGYKVCYCDKHVRGATVLSAGRQLASGDVLEFRLKLSIFAEGESSSRGSAARSSGQLKSSTCCNDLGREHK